MLSTKRKTTELDILEIWRSYQIYLSAKMTPRPFLLVKYFRCKLRKSIGSRIETARPDKPLESMEMLSGELKDSLMNILQVQIIRAIHSAVNDRVIPEIQSVLGTLSSRQKDTESDSSNNKSKINVRKQTD